MTRDDIIRMAWKANLPSCHITHPKALERFAALVAAAERERQWVGLTEEEVLEEEEFINHRYGKHINETTAILLDFVRQIEAKLKEKNGG
jgi:hypothetical protein